MRGEDVLARQAAVVRAGPIGDVDLGGEHELVARGELRQGARPVTSSLTPSEYMSAVSKKLMPASTARADERLGCAPRRAPRRASRSLP